MTATRAGPRAASAIRPSSRPARPVTWATNRGLHARRSTAGHTASIPSTTRSPSIVTRIPASRAQPTATAAAAASTPSTWRSRPEVMTRAVELVGADGVGGRAPVEAGPEAGPSVDEHDGHVADAAAGPERVAHVHAVPGEQPPAQARPVVVAELADVAGPEAQPGARDHGGRDHAAPLDLELPQGRLGVRLRIAVDDAQEVERVGAQADDVDGIR